MSNKTTLQSNNTKLTNNNTDLTSILNTINNLPTAGNGGADEWKEMFISAIDDSLGANITKLPEGLTSIGTSAFQMCSNLAITSIPETVTSIGNHAFYNCKNLAITKLPDNLTQMGEYAMYYCIKSNLKELPNTLTSIGVACFRDCVLFTELTIPPSLTNIGNQAFYRCSNLTKIIFNSTTPATIGTNVFQTTPIASGTGYIYVPDASIDTYKNATNWSVYAAQIKPISELS